MYPAVKVSKCILYLVHAFVVIDMSFATAEDGIALRKVEQIIDFGGFPDFDFKRQGNDSEEFAGIKAFNLNNAEIFRIESGILRISAKAGSRWITEDNMLSRNAPYAVLEKKLKLSGTDSIKAEGSLESNTDRLFGKLIQGKVTPDGSIAQSPFMGLSDSMGSLPGDGRLVSFSFTQRSTHITQFAEKKVIDRASYSQSNMWTGRTSLSYSYDGLQDISSFTNKSLFLKLSWPKVSFASKAEVANDDPKRLIYMVFGVENESDKQELENQVEINKLSFVAEAVSQ